VHSLQCALQLGRAAEVGGCDVLQSVEQGVACIDPACEGHNRHAAIDEEPRDRAACEAERPGDSGTWF